MKAIIKIILCFFLVSIIVSCGSSGKESLKAETERISKIINEGFLKLENSVTEVANKVSDIYSQRDQSNLDVTKMDVSQGGRYQWFQNTVYYNPKKGNESLIFATGNPAVNDEIKSKMLLLELLEPVLQKNKNEFVNISSINFFFEDNAIISEPWFDIISALPPKINFTQFDWYKMGINDEKIAKWTAEPFASIGGQGYFMTVANASYDKDGNVLGVATADMVMSNVVKDNIRDNENLILFLSKDTILIGYSKVTEDKFKLKLLEDYNYLEQLQKNEFIADEFKLTHESQDKDIIELSKKIKAGETDFEIQINNNKYYVTVSTIDKVVFYIVGLLKV